MVNWKRFARISCKVGAQAFLIGSGVLAGYRYSEYLAVAEKSLHDSLQPSMYEQKMDVLEELVTYANR
jgi:hypothetical protein